MPDNLNGTDTGLDALIDQIVSEIPDEEQPETDSEEVVEVTDEDIEEVLEADSDEGEATDDIEEDDEEEADADPEDEEDEQAEEDDTVYEIKVDGETVQVTLNELQDGYSRQADYSRKTKALADDRTAFQQEVEETKNRITQQIQVEQQKLLTTMNQALELAELNDPVISLGNETDWQELAREDPAEYTTRKAEYDARIQSKQQLMAERQKLQKEHMTAQYQNEVRKLVSISPEWGDATKNEALYKTVTDTLTSDAIGFTAEEAQAGFADHRQVLVVQAAAKWFAHEAAQKGIAKKKVVKKATKVIKPKGSSNVASDSARKQSNEKKLNQNPYNTDAQVDFALKELGL